ncbi:hypothetical protein DVH24_016530 [Malus domestica]|uniref:Nitrate transporter 1/peptide transporter family protein n=1 Tax=Malus domestica TaxID=3750 RepID=A0A498HQ90_MALDO|nr:hypothetical protein DVH24_016530 [Malus domestica]
MAASPCQSPEPDAQTPLLDDVVDGAVDHKGRPVHRSRSGGWRSARFIIGVEVAERFAYYGIGSNLITFLTGPLGQSTATAAENVNIWSGTASLLPLLGAFVADSFLGRYRTIVYASLLYILGLGLLTLSAVLSSSEIQLLHKADTSLVFRHLELISLMSQIQRSAKPKAHFSIGGTSVTLILLTYIQDNLSWGLGFGIPCIAMVFALLIFLLGTRTYRYSIKGDEESPFVRIGRVFVAALRNWRTSPSAVTSEEESRGILTHKSSEQFKFLNKALLAPDDLKENRKVCTIVDVEDAKAVLRLFPIWVTCLAYAVVFAQYSTFFTKQGATMDRTIVPGFNVPAASLQTFISIAIVIFLPIYDRIFVPIARYVTGKPAGITMLQRIGTGMVLSIILMVIAALVEMKRLKTAKDYGLLDTPSATVPMSIWWLAPQYLLAGIADGFTMVGLQEFFYDQVPNELRSVGLALYLSIFGVGSFLSSFLISIIDDITSLAGESSWFSSNLNRAHLDYFYWLLGGINDGVEGTVDHKGRPVHRSRSGGWRSARFIIGVELAERFAYYGISSNLITFLTGPLGQSTVTAAENVNIWSGTASLLPLLGAFVADSFLGRYRTIVFASLLYILNAINFGPKLKQGLGLLTLSAVLSSSEIQLLHKEDTSLAFRHLELISLMCQIQRSAKPEAHSSIGGTSLTYILLTYIQENLSWGLGFGIPCIAMVFALLLFLLGTRTYRYSINGDEESPFVRIGNVFVAALRNWRTTPAAVTSEEESRGTLPHESSEQFTFLNKALLAPDDLKENRRVCTIVDVEEAKAVLRLFPIWATCLAYAVVFAQCSTFFTKQGATMDRTVVPGFDVPAASLQILSSIAIIISLPIYDRIFVPVARSFTRIPSGISMLQRIGTGMFMSLISMVIAALVEMKRLKTAKDYGLLDTPSATVPMSIWWLVPQYLLTGISDVFTMVGLQELFYDQVPNELRSVGLALYLSIFGVGSFISSFLISVIDDITSLPGESSWFSDNLNRAHLDYFYWLLGGISLVQLVVYLYFAKSYIYKSHDLEKF